jgi:hypothetical protein
LRSLGVSGLSRAELFYSPNSRLADGRRRSSVSCFVSAQGKEEVAAERLGRTPKEVAGAGMFRSVANHPVWARRSPALPISTGQKSSDALARPPRSGDQDEPSADVAGLADAVGLGSAIERERLNL